RRSSGHQVVEQVSGDVRDLGDGAVERLLVGGRRLGSATHLAHELQGGVVDLARGGRWLEVVEGSDVAAHGCEPTSWKSWHASSPVTRRQLLSARPAAREHSEHY